MATTPESAHQGTQSDKAVNIPANQSVNKPAAAPNHESKAAPRSTWRRLGWFVALWGASVFALWVISWIIRWAIS